MIAAVRLRLQREHMVQFCCGAETQVYAGPLDGGGRAVALFNRHHPEYMYNNITVSWSDIGCAHEARAVVRDMFKCKDLGTFSGAPRPS